MGLKSKPCGVSSWREKAALSNLFTYKCILGLCAARTQAEQHPEPNGHGLDDCCAPAGAAAVPLSLKVSVQAGAEVTHTQQREIQWERKRETVNTLVHRYMIQIFKFKKYNELTIVLRLQLMHPADTATLSQYFHMIVSFLLNNEKVAFVSDNKN